MPEVLTRTGPCLLFREKYSGGYEFWWVYDHTAEVYELFLAEQCDDYIGCADDMASALRVARQWLESERGTR